VVNRVPKHVLQGRDNALKHPAVHLAFGVIHFKINRLIEFTCYLTHATPQARHHARKVNHLRAHQALLQLSIDPRLLYQQSFHISAFFNQGAPQVSQIRCRLKQGAR